MPEGPFSNLTEIQNAFQEWDRAATLYNFRIACYLGLVLMPAGVVLDHYVYQEMVPRFLKLRLLSDVVIAGFLLFLMTRFAKRHYRTVGVALAMVPTSFLSIMIYLQQGAESPYYAGLNLVLLVFAFVMHWTFRETLIAVSLVIGCYLAACLGHGPISGQSGTFVNNIYFLVLTGVIVATGRFYHSRQRFREFALRYELDKSRKALETSLQQLKESEMQLVQSEKLASLGRMSAGLIHEINNPLNYAATGLFTLRNKGKYIAPDQQAEYTETLADVEEGLKRVKTIVSDLRIFTHPNTEQLDQVDVAEIVESALRFFSHEWKDKVHIERSLAEHQVIHGNKNKLIHVLVNLVQNSLDAVRNKTFGNGEQPLIRIEGRVENGLSILKVRDNGYGIRPDHLGKIFDPFFTTKDVGEGMGLGLSIVYRIVQECGGTIAARSEVDRFCEFTMEFPLK